jgi:hypothetical protein
MMPSALPIACSLSASELPERLAELAAVGRASLLAVAAEENRAELRFAAAARERLAAIVAAESQCCGFLALRLEEQSDAALLTIEAPAGAGPGLDGLVAAFSRDREAA